VVEIAAPPELEPADALSYERAQPLASHWIGRLVLLGLIALPLWKGAHHLRSLSVDFGGAARDTAVATLLYGIAALGGLRARGPRSGWGTGLRLTPCRPCLRFCPTRR
jgi:fumarate reductase subunit D